MTSSSSSSECDCEECYCYGVGSNTKNHRRVWRHPFSSNTTQPLVYYAQVPPTCKRPRSREIRKENPNCFVKAFRWYTQEHLPPRNQFSNISPNMTGFATWLDTKYHQFIRESPLDQTTYLFKLHQTSSFEAYKSMNSKERNPNHAKKSRIRSPWKKRRGQNREGGDMSQKSHHSFEYILQPKEITRNVSEWWQPIPTSLRNRSNVTIVSTDVCNCKKPATKSLSLTSVHRENKTNETFLTKKTDDKINIEDTFDTNDTSKVAKTIQTRDISCQCVEEVASKISTETQYENPVINVIKSEEAETKINLLPGQFRQRSSSKLGVIISPFEEMPKKGTVRKIVQEFDPKRHVSCQYTEDVTKIDTCSQCDENFTSWTTSTGPQETNILAIRRPPKCVKSAVTYTINGSNSLSIFMTSAVQTSDHSINLGNDLVQQYPFFMKIVCADKLCEECINR